MKWQLMAQTIMNLQQSQIEPSPSQTFSLNFYSLQVYWGHFTNAYCSLFFKAGAVNSNIFKGQASNENEATGLSGEYGKQEAYTCSVSKEASIAQFKQIIILQKCRPNITRLSNFLDAKNQYFNSKIAIFKWQQLSKKKKKKKSSTAEQTKLIWPEGF